MSRTAIAGLAAALALSGCADLSGGAVRREAPPQAQVAAPAEALRAAGPPQSDAVKPVLEPPSGPDLPAFFDCLRENAITVVSAHRGGPANGFPENALETMAKLAGEAGAAPIFFEVDVRRTKDGALVLLHDETLERTTTGEGALADRTRAELAALHLKDKGGRATPYRIPDLGAALAWAEGHVLQLDLKRPLTAADVAPAIEAADAASRVIIIAYSLADAIAAHRRLPDTMLSVSIGGPDDVAALEAAGVDLARVLAWTGTRDLKPELYRAVGAKGVEVIFGTLGRAESWDTKIAAMGDDIQYLALADQGIHMIASDRPRNAANGVAQEVLYEERIALCRENLTDAAPLQAAGP